MKSLEYELEFITPAFIGGANPDEAKLRPASIIGMLRWWFRAIWTFNNTERLYEEETDLFGGHKEDGSIGSRLVIRIEEVNLTKGQEIKSEYNLNWSFDRKTGYTKGQHSGIAYLLHSAFRRPYIKDKSRFKLKVVLLGLNEDKFKLFEGALWCFVNLGGLGYRSRRGFGSLSVININGESRLDFLPKEPIAKWLSENFQRIYELRKPNPTHKYSNILGSHLVISFKKFSSWIEALNDIGFIYQNFRKSKKHEVFGVGIFGLPVVHRNRTTIEAESYNRRASPLIMRVIRVEDYYRWICIWLNGEFLPSGEKLVLSGGSGNNKKIIKKGSVEKRLLEDFWNKLKKYGQEITVGGSLK